MVLTDYFYPEYSIGWDYAKACGVKNAVLRLPEDDRFDLENITHWQTLVNKLENFGMKTMVIEPLPNRIHDHIKNGDAHREESIRTVIKMLEIMDKLDIRILCFNFMAKVGWLRTNTDVLERDVAYVTAFDAKKVHYDGEGIDAHKLWENYEIFIKGIIPYAEKYGIYLALHPDDPPLQSIGAVSRIMNTIDNIQRAMHVVESDFLGLTMCQANFYLMDPDICKSIEKFKNKIRFIHFRNVSGQKVNFKETFHDNGDLPMAKLIRCYEKNNIDVPIRVDHVPTMCNEKNVVAAGYGNTGKLFALGYLKGLLEIGDTIETERNQ